ncbi:glycosyltransferase [Peribacillus frigoritolerans]|uniref:glycosyltransferase n=1 Tax=Peribacillus frigoritolerans TaxID=450367 RepID=UPI00315D0FB4
MKKVLIMLSSMNIGGVEKSLLSLLSVFPKENYEITILLLEKKGEFLNYLPDWVKVEEVNWYKYIKPIITQPPQMTVKTYIHNKNFLELLIFLFSYYIDKKFNQRYLFYKNIFRNVSNRNDYYDVAISYQGPTDIIDYYIINKVKAKKKISWVHFDISNHQINDRFYKKIYKKFSKIYVVSKEARNELTKKFPYYKSKTSTFLNIISSKVIKEMSEKEEYLDRSFSGIKIVTVGRLSKEKGQDIAISVLSRLRKNGYDVRWYCIGEGNYRKELETLITEYKVKHDFILCGSTTNPYPQISKADIYVQPSLHDGYCLALTEAKILNKPIVATNFVGAIEQIVDGKTGVIANCNEEDLFEKIKYLIDHKEIRNRLSKNLSNQHLDTISEIEKLMAYLK